MLITSHQRWYRGLGISVFLFAVTVYSFNIPMTMIKGWLSSDYTSQEVPLIASHTFVPPIVYKKNVSISDIKVKNVNTLKKLYSKSEYVLAKKDDVTVPIPRLFVRNMPQGWTHISSIEEKKQLFIQMILPLILKANETILQERNYLAYLEEKWHMYQKLTPTEAYWLEELAVKYEVEGLVLHEQFNALWQRVDYIPVSLALAQSIEESGWGTSYFVNRGNALFGQIALDEGMAPRNNPKGIKTKHFPSLLSSVHAYMHNLNTHPAYKKLRVKRAQIRGKDIAYNQRLSAQDLIPYLKAYSERGNGYLKNLNKIFGHNNLRQYDQCMLQKGNQ